MYYLGIDIGSLSCDAVIIDDSGAPLAATVFPTGAQNHLAIQRAMAAVIEKSGISASDIKATVSTGYGRERVEGRTAAVTEITCHAKGIHALFPDTRILIDIGGQDSKAVFMGKDGKVSDFAMNDKCAAGTGRFLEAMARALQVDITELGELDHGAKQNITLSSMCTVFAESEVVSLIANGVAVNEIVRGLNRSIASRTKSLVKRVAPETNGFRMAMSGGVARNGGVVRALSDIMGDEIRVPDQPDTVGAFGAALIARERGG